MPRKMSDHERRLRERWPKWKFWVEGYRGHYGGEARLPTAQMLPVNQPRVRGHICTTPWSTWRSLERAMERTKRALKESCEKVVYVRRGGKGKWGREEKP